MHNLFFDVWSVQLISRRPMIACLVWSVAALQSLVLSLVDVFLIIRGNKCYTCLFTELAHTTTCTCLPLQGSFSIIIEAFDDLSQQGPQSGLIDSHCQFLTEHICKSSFVCVYYFFCIKTCFNGFYLFSVCIFFVHYFYLFYWCCGLFKMSCGYANNKFC
jgi:hypothetical protein